MSSIHGETPQWNYRGCKLGSFATTHAGGFGHAARAFAVTDGGSWLLLRATAQGQLPKPYKMTWKQLTSSQASMLT